MSKRDEQNNYDSNWLAPDIEYLPDFIICGAMKCGTTSLHAMLNCHPNVYIPEDELHFFDLDNIAQHPEFNQFKDNKWYSPNLNTDAEPYWQWYKEQFSNASEGQLKGEDSTTYIASRCAARRIAMQKKPVKLIVMLRQPTARVYSHYWHMVRAGKALFNFEDTLQFQPFNLLDRSLYFSQLKSLFEVVPKEHVKVVIFEEFIENPEAQLKEICDFLNIDVSLLPQNAYSIHENHSSIPRFIGFHLLKCRLLRRFSRGQNRKAFPNEVVTVNKSQFWFNRIYQLLNPLITKKPPKINRSSKEYLDNYFYKELQGLDELIGRPVLARWFSKE